jgi:hypothetical protein
MIFSALVGPETHLQVFERPVSLSSVISEDHLTSERQGGYLLLTTNKPHNSNQIKSHKMWEKK